MSNWNKAKLPLEILGIALLIVALGVGISKFSTPRSALYSPADIVRVGEKAWEEYHAAPKPVASFTPKERSWEDVRITSGTGGVQVEMPKSTVTGATYFPMICSEMRFGETLTLGATTSTLCLTAIGIGCPAPDTAKKMEAVFRWFGADGKPVVYDDVDKLKKSFWADCNLYCPNLFFLLTGGKYLDRAKASLFDVRTHLCLGGTNIGERAKNGAMLPLPNVRTWCGAPAELVLDIPDDPVKVREFEPKVGEGFRDGIVDMRLASVVDGMKGMKETGLKEGEPDFLIPDSGTASWAFIFQPERPPFAKIDFIGVKGKSVYSFFEQTRSGGQVIVRTIGLSKDVRKIRVSYLLATRRVTIHIPELPGFLDENRNIKDFSAVRIPYVKFAALGNALDRVKELLHCSGLRDESHFRGGTLPPEQLEFKNMTVGEITESLARSMNADVSMREGDLVFRKHKTFREKMQECWVKTLTWLRIK